MARPKSDVLTAREAQIMRLLWDHGDMTSDAVRARLPDNPHDSIQPDLIVAQTNHIGPDVSKLDIISGTIDPRPQAHPFDLPDGNMDSSSPPDYSHRSHLFRSSPSSYNF